MTSPFDQPEKRNTNDELFLDKVAADLEILMKTGARIEDCLILVDAVGDFQVIHMPNITVDKCVARLAKVPMIILSHKFLEGHTGIISVELSSI